MSLTDPNPVPTAQKRAEDAHARLRVDLDALIRREVNAVAGHSDWAGDVDPARVLALREALTGVLRQLIENADDADTSRPAFAMVEVIGADGSTDFSVFPGYWHPDGTWRDADLGPGGEMLCQRIAYAFSGPETDAPVRVSLTISDFTGEMTMPRTFHAADVPDRPSDLVLPQNPSTLGEDLRSQVRAARQRAAKQLEAKGWPSAASDVIFGLPPLSIIRRVEREARDLSARARALPVLLALEEELERIAGQP